MKGLRFSWLVVGVMLISTVALWPETADGRGGGGRGGGGGGRGGGGGGRVGGGGGGFSGGGGRGGGAPSFSRPSTPVSRPSPGVSRPSAGVSRPSGGATRPSTLPSRPAVGGPSGISGRPSAGTLPSGPQLGSRPGVGTGPGQLPAGRPGVGDGPGVAGRPGVGERPGIGAGPGQLPANRPGISAGVGAGIGAGVGAIAGSKLGERPTQLPGLDGGSRREQFQNNRQDWVADRQQDLQSRLENRQDFRNDWQENRQDFLNDRREDWQNQLDDRYPWHDGWHHGYWHGGWGNYWEHMWGEHPVWSAFAVTGWALNAAGYMFGTWGYTNPYYDAAYASTAPYDYSEPIVIYSEPAQAAAPSTQAVADGSGLPPGVSQEALNQFEQARAAFGQGDYKQALALANQALKSMPSDATLHEFRALCLFALGQYREAAATLNAVLAVGPGWDWTTMASLYPDVEVYTTQLRKLEDYIRSNPNASDARFVLAYHYITAGHNDAAAKQLEYVVKAVPNDAVAKQIYDMLTYKSTGEVKPKAEPAAPAGPKVTAQDLAGTWKAKGPSNSAFEMTLTKAGEFTWKYAKGKKEQVVKGAYAVDRNTLAMEPGSGGVMLAELTPQNANAVDFKMIGAPENEPPLKFTR